MAALAAVCGVLIVALGLMSAGRAPSPVELGIEITAFACGIALCFQAVILSRLKRLERRIEALSMQRDAASRAD